MVNPASVDDPTAEMNAFIALCRVAFFVALVLAGVTWVFGLAAEGISSAHCAHRKLREGALANDAVGFLLASAWMVFMVYLGAWPPQWANKQLRNTFATYVAPTWSFGSRTISYAMFVC